jgi:hypothetical protein
VTATVTGEPNPAEAFARQLGELLGEPWHIEVGSVLADQPYYGAELSYTCSLVDTSGNAEDEVSDRGLRIRVGSLHPELVSIRGYGAMRFENPQILWWTNDPTGAATLVQKLILPICLPAWNRQIAIEEQRRQQADVRKAWRTNLREQVPAIGEPYADPEDDEVIVMPLELGEATVNLVHNSDDSVTIHAEVTTEFAARAAHALAALADGER